MNRRAQLQAMATLSGKTYIPVYDPILRAFRDGATSIDFSEYYKPSSNIPIQFSHIVLGSPLRQFFISVKGKLEKAIVGLADQHIKQRLEGKGVEQTPLAKAVKVMVKVLPEITKQNSEAVNAHTMDRIFERFATYVKFKFRMFQEAFKVIKFELGHDKAYDDAFQILLEEIIKEILRGNWKVRSEEQYPLFWTNQTPKGGKHSIISILQDKKALENLLGDKWKLED